jgi:hypothetical protein
MLIASTGILSTIRPKEVNVTVQGGPPADGRLELQQARATQPVWEKRKWRKREPARNGVGPKGRLCLNKQKRQRRPHCAMRELIKRRGGPSVPSRI